MTAVTRERTTMHPPSRFWDKIAERYAKKPVADEAAYQKKLEVTRQYFRPDMEVLEFGCGTGSTAIAHAPYVKHVRATDISAKMIEIAQGKADAAGIGNVSFERTTIEDLEVPDASLDVVMGHSMGEYAAAATAGVLSFEHGLLLVAKRGLLMRDIARGDMIAVALSEQEVQPFIGGLVDVAALNTSQQTVLSGRPEAVAAVTRRLQERDIAVARLATSHAFRQFTAFFSRAPHGETSSGEIENRVR